jgi:hypothetical protein
LEVGAVLAGQGLAEIGVLVVHAVVSYLDALGRVFRDQATVVAGLQDRGVPGRRAELDWLGWGRCRVGAELQGQAGND